MACLSGSSLLLRKWLPAMDGGPLAAGRRWEDAQPGADRAHLAPNSDSVAHCTRLYCLYLSVTII
jgi:hypothetical protein